MASFIHCHRPYPGTNLRSALFSSRNGRILFQFYRLWHWLIRPQLAPRFCNKLGGTEFSDSRNQHCFLEFSVIALILRNLRDIFPAGHFYPRDPAFHTFQVESVFWGSLKIITKNKKWKVPISSYSSDLCKKWQSDHLKISQSSEIVHANPNNYPSITADSEFFIWSFSVCFSSIWPLGQEISCS